MLAKPNVIDIIPKVGDRYEVAIAVAKRARQIEKERIQNSDRDIRDSVDVATDDIFEDKVKVEKIEKKSVKESELDDTLPIIHEKSDLVANDVKDISKGKE